MNEELRRHEENLAFFGRVGADVSHEMRNVLSIIGEYAGLLDDLLVLAEGGKPLDSAKLKKLVANIIGNVEKGTEAMERFSRLAHAAEEQTASVDLTALTGNVVALAQRQVKLAGCRLEARLPHEAIPISASPFGMHHILFCSIELILELLEGGEVVRIEVVNEGPSAVISVSGSAPVGGDLLPGRTAQLSALMDELKGSVKASWADGIVSLILSIPTQ